MISTSARSPAAAAGAFARRRIRALAEARGVCRLKSWPLVRGDLEPPRIVGAKPGPPIDFPVGALRHGARQGGRDQPVGLGAAQQRQQQRLQQQMRADEGRGGIARQAEHQPAVGKPGVPARLARLHGDPLEDHAGAEALQHRPQHVALADRGAAQRQDDVGVEARAANLLRALRPVVGQYRRAGSRRRPRPRPARPAHRRPN